MRLVHWLDKEMIGKPQSFIKDEIDERLNSYYWAIRKHGMQTVNGMFSSLLDAKFLAGTSAVASATMYTANDPLLSALVAGISIGGKVIVSLHKMSVDIEDIKRSHPEVAFVHEIKERFGEKSK